jgi:membrane dipeptidase
MSQDQSLHFHNTERLNVAYPFINQYHYLQNFAIFIEDSYNMINPFAGVIESIDDFQDKILSDSNIIYIRNKSDLTKWYTSEKLGAMLSLEGVDALDDPFEQIQILTNHGMSIVSLTWNHSNWAADGTYGTLHGGISSSGKSFIEYVNRLQLILDVSHLSDHSFWQLTELTNRPLMATHSNSRTVCNHPRNLDDRQIKYLLNHDGFIALNFIPFFVSEQYEDVTSHHLLRHIDHICSIGGSDQIGLGSDFDGSDKMIKGLENPSKFIEFVELLEKHYNKNWIQRFLSENCYQFLYKHLPDDQSNN